MAKLRPPPVFTLLLLSQSAHCVTGLFNAEASLNCGCTRSERKRKEYTAVTAGGQCLLSEYELCACVALRPEPCTAVVHVCFHLARACLLVACVLLYSVVVGPRTRLHCMPFSHSTCRTVTGSNRRYCTRTMHTQAGSNHPAITHFTCILCCSMPSLSSRGLGLPVHLWSLRKESPLLKPPLLLLFLLPPAAAMTFQ